MSKIEGTNVAAPVVPFDTADTFATHDEQYGAGGYRSVLTLAARDAIPADRRRAGMRVKVLAADEGGIGGRLYELGSDLATWTGLAVDAELATAAQGIKADSALQAGAPVSQLAETDQAKIMTAAERILLALLGGTVRVLSDDTYAWAVVDGSDAAYVLIGALKGTGQLVLPYLPDNLQGAAASVRLESDPLYFFKIVAKAVDGEEYVLFGVRTDLTIDGVPALRDLVARIRFENDPDYYLKEVAKAADGEEYILHGIKVDGTIVGMVGDAIRAAAATAGTALATAQQALSQGSGGIGGKIKSIARRYADRNPIDLPDGGDALATFSTAAYGSPPSALTQQLDMQDAVQGRLFDFTGGIKVLESSTSSYGVLSNTLRNNPTDPSQTSGPNSAGVTKISFLFDGPSFAFMSFGPVRVSINGQFITRGHFTVPFNSGYSWGVITLADQTRRLRLVTLEFFQGSGPIGRYIRIGANDTIAPAPTGDRLRVTIFGDSFSTATGASERWRGITHILAYLLGGMQADVWITGIGGTGYENDGAGVGADGQSVPQQYKAIDHIQDLAHGFDLIVMALGINDPDYGYSGSAATYQANVLATLRAARVQAPNALIAVAGCWSGNGAPVQKVLDNEGAIQSAFTQWADANSLFVPVSADPSGAWVTAVNAATIKDDSPDDTHPGDYGHDYLARRLRAAILSQIGA